MCQDGHEWSWESGFPVRRVELGGAPCGSLQTSAPVTPKLLTFPHSDELCPQRLPKDPANSGEGNRNQIVLPQSWHSKLCYVNQLPSPRWASVSQSLKWGSVVRHPLHSLPADFLRLWVPLTSTSPPLFVSNTLLAQLDTPQGQGPLYSLLLYPKCQEICYYKCACRPSVCIPGELIRKRLSGSSPHLLTHSVFE